MTFNLTDIYPMILVLVCVTCILILISRGRWKKKAENFEDTAAQANLRLRRLQEENLSNSGMSVIFGDNKILLYAFKTARDQLDAASAEIEALRVRLGENTDVPSDNLKCTFGKCELRIHKDHPRAHCSSPTCSNPNTVYCSTHATRLLNSEGLCAACSNEDLICCDACKETFTSTLLNICTELLCETMYCDNCMERNLLHGMCTKCREAAN